MAARPAFDRYGGTIKVIGTPAEEGGDGKLYMIRAGAFRAVTSVELIAPGAAGDDVDTLLRPTYTLQEGTVHLSDEPGAGLQLARMEWRHAAGGGLGDTADYRPALARGMRPARNRPTQKIRSKKSHCLIL